MNQFTGRRVCKRQLSAVEETNRQDARQRRCRWRRRQSVSHRLLGLIESEEEEDGLYCEQVQATF